MMKEDMQNTHLDEENKALAGEVRRLKRENEDITVAAGACLIFAAFAMGLLFGYIIGDF